MEGLSTSPSSNGLALVVCRLTMVGSVRHEGCRALRNTIRGIVFCSLLCLAMTTTDTVTTLSVVVVATVIGVHLSGTVRAACDEVRKSSVLQTVVESFRGSGLTPKPDLETRFSSLRLIAGFHVTV